MRTSISLKQMVRFWRRSLRRMRWQSKSVAAPSGEPATFSLHQEICLNRDVTSFFCSTVWPTSTPDEDPNADHRPHVLCPTPKDQNHRAVKLPKSPFLATWATPKICSEAISWPFGWPFVPTQCLQTWPRFPIIQQFFALPIPPCTLPSCCATVCSWLAYHETRTCSTLTKAASAALLWLEKFPAGRLTLLHDVALKDQSLPALEHMLILYCNTTRPGTADGGQKSHPTCDFRTFNTKKDVERGRFPFSSASTPLLHWFEPIFQTFSLRLMPPRSRADHLNFLRIICIFLHALLVKNLGPAAIVSKWSPTLQISDRTRHPYLLWSTLWHRYLVRPLTPLWAWIVERFTMLPQLSLLRGASTKVGAAAQRQEWLASTQRIHCRLALRQTRPQT